MPMTSTFYARQCVDDVNQACMILMHCPPQGSVWDAAQEKPFKAQWHTSIDAFRKQVLLVNSERAHTRMYRDRPGLVVIVILRVCSVLSCVIEMPSLRKEHFQFAYFDVRQTPDMHTMCDVVHAENAEGKLLQRNEAIGECRRHALIVQLRLWRLAHACMAVYICECAHSVDEEWWPVHGGV